MTASKGQLQLSPAVICYGTQPPAWLRNLSDLANVSALGRGGGVEKESQQIALAWAVTLPLLHKSFCRPSVGRADSGPSTPSRGTGPARSRARGAKAAGWGCNGLCSPNPPTSPWRDGAFSSAFSKNSFPPLEWEFSPKSSVIPIPAPTPQPGGQVLGLDLCQLTHTHILFGSCLSISDPLFFFFFGSIKLIFLQPFGSDHQADSLPPPVLFPVGLLLRENLAHGRFPNDIK